MSESPSMPDPDDDMEESLVIDEDAGATPTKKGKKRKAKEPKEPKERKKRGKKKKKHFGDEDDMVEFNSDTDLSGLMGNDTDYTPEPAPKKKKRTPKPKPAPPPAQVYFWKVKHARFYMCLNQRSK
ncbi:unnamed protein product [Owenia fusiformis]|uniref:Uncharacterized protein n=1 Tax=Owenia fusiformis TaxID=6347 RepID=A0A8S4N5X4_OWEFU|nr:unnamed protein product [Owenia fusiformis]